MILNKEIINLESLRIGFVILVIFFISSTDKLYAQKILDGYINSKNKTKVNCKIFEPKNKFQEYKFIEIYDTVHGIKKLYPNQIDGYNIKGNSYESILLDDTILNSRIKIFTKVISKGKVTLLYSPILDNLILDIYFFKKDNEKFYHIYRGEEIIDLGEGPYKTYGFNKEQVFLSFFNWYFNDCPRISRALSSRTYTIEDIEMIFKDYNNCF